MVKHRLSNYLICPACKAHPLRLTILEKRIYPDRAIKVEPCDSYCAYLDKRNGEIVDPPCDECMKIEIIDGYYTCPECGEWYPIIDMIAIMHRGRYRPRKVIERFIEKYRDRLPDEIVARELSRE